ncbi:finTRIM family, member 86 isoform X3 [Cynoglossus semilaevis]|uniref:finTRIM family, member 86 isoform X3 n=1 Tax=Cynoglossus semilaevis TaxID=244447 RepID=UPI0007DCB088|nr:tripartite motif-containing protein 65-like isoform X3 [Cynoglossus semilaevis]
MASAWTEEETLLCSVCLDILKEPATLPCGHSYCLVCIQSHWDKRDSNGQYSCPQCRQIFNPRPSLAKSTVLAEVMEKLRTNSFKGSSSTSAWSSSPAGAPNYLEVLGSVYPHATTVDPRCCPHHGLPLNMFCHEDGTYVCEVCCQNGHKGHRVVRPQEEREQRQKELFQRQAEVQRRIQGTEQKLKELPPLARQQKALVQAVGHETTELFSELAKNVSQTGSRVIDLLNSHEIFLGNVIEGHVYKLEQERAQLQWMSEELSRVAAIEDNICFLKNFFTMEPLAPVSAPEESMFNKEELVIASIRSATKELQTAVELQCKASFDRIMTLVNPDLWTVAPSDEGSCSSGVEKEMNTLPLPPPRPQEEQMINRPPSPPPRPQEAEVGYDNKEPQTREELQKFYFEPTMDPNTAYRHVQLSDGGQKATLRAENLNPPNHLDRFQFWRQVLCREPLAGSPYYWEVEWKGQKISIGVCYKDMERKSSDVRSRLGHNVQSWSLYWSGTGFSFWHNGQEKLLGSPKAKRIGVYVDQHVGILAFYSITNKQADLIHSHHTQFTGPLYPGFRFWSIPGASVTICKMD